jgi:UTP-glucose-1-phosphate uridylyltransferase
VGGSWVDGDETHDLLDIAMFKEKPDKEFAAEFLSIDGLPEHTYLTVFGLYILTSGLFAELARASEEGEANGHEVQLTDALEQRRRAERFLGLIIDGEKIDIGLPEGYLAGLVKFAGRT